MITDYIPKTIPVQTIETCKKTWDYFKTVGRSQSCIEMCTNIYNKIITPKPRLLDDKLLQAMKKIITELGEPEDLETMNKLIAKNTIEEPTLKKIHDEEFSWNPTFWPVALKDFEHEFAGPKPRNSGLTKEYVLIPHLELKSSLVKMAMSVWMVLLVV